MPYNVQRLAYEAWELLRAGDAEALTAAVADRALDRIVRGEDPAYTQIWTSLSTNQKKTLKAVITMGGERSQSAETSRRFAIPTPSVQVALGALEDRHLIRRESRDGGTRYRLVDPFFAPWLDMAQSV